ncbi:Zinc finger CCHC domain-containing protein 9 [Frankliniella fusca]|uniref:Zinc finger CCHC domain-containing protein 9 n=1 Tax=Frankliniella fusca TaxID=407009 RepID=A0AAE1I416_9NEOP|nr:Zinc finger CCHC domain-containing protein 9 [Frankliniella fusca]
MTRFARAKGSKSSNERVAEEATNWKEFKRQIDQKKVDSSQSKDDSVAQSVIKRIKQEKQVVTETDWADFGLPRVSVHLQEKVAKKRKKVEDSVKEQVVTLKKKQKIANNIDEQDKTYTESNDVAEHQVEPIKKKKIKVKKESSAVEMPADAVEAKDSSEITRKKKKKGNQSADNQNSNLSQLQATPASGKGASFKRRKPFVESSTLHINGITINISKFDGFDVKTEDAARLKELRSKMLKEGIPRPEVDKAMKLERRKAEKALAREKKKVCFNCRQAGHLLSECPEVGSFGSSKRFDSSAVNICYKCGSTEHTHFQCQVKKKKEYSFATCFICKEQGHISSQCPDNPRGLYPQGGSCKVCGEVTHLKKDCPQLSQEKVENTVTLDTFASNSKVESLGDDFEHPKQEKKLLVKQRKIIKF